DLVTAFLIALKDQPDATLVLKLMVSPELADSSVNQVLAHCRGLRHRCKLVLIADPFSEDEMHELVRGTTYYVTATRAEEAGFPLQSFLASGRPGIAPRHTALADYFDARVGWVVDS